MKHSYLLALITLFCLTVFATAKDEVQGKISKGRSMLRTEKHEEGMKLLKNAALELQNMLKEKPEDFNAAYQLGMVYFYLEQDTHALIAYSQASEIDQTDSRPWFFMGLIQRYAGDLDQAEKNLLRSTELSPKDADSWYELGVVYYDAAKDEKAIRAFKRTLEINPNHKQASYKLALNYMNHAEAEKAYPLLSETVREQPDNLNAQYNFGQLCQNMGKTEESMAAFQRVVEMDPTDWRALSKLVQLNQKSGNDEARDDARRKIFDLKKARTVKSLNEEPLYVRDQFDVDGQLVMALEYFEMEGDRAIRYSFVITDTIGKKGKYRITLGSYEGTNRVAHEVGDIEDGKRLFHLDHYPEDGSHYLLGFFRGEPEYDTVKPMVIKAIKGESEVISSTVPDPSNS